MGGGVGLLLIRSWVLGNEAHENRNGVLLFIREIYMLLYEINNNLKEDYTMEIKELKKIIETYMDDYKKLQLKAMEDNNERKVDQFTGSLIALGNVLYQIEVSEENEIQS